MKYVLIFYSTTPPQHVDDVAVRKAKSVWTFKSSTSLEFDNRTACEANGQIVIDGLDNVDTMTATGWCLCKEEPGTICADDKPAVESSKNFKWFTTQKVQPRSTDEVIGLHQLVSGPSRKCYEKENHQKRRDVLLNEERHHNRTMGLLPRFQI
jgi:hypothetical protein